MQRVNLGVLITKRKFGWFLELIVMDLDGNMKEFRKINLDNDSILVMTEWVNEHIEETRKYFDVVNLFRENHKGDVTAYYYDNTGVRWISPHKQAAKSMTGIFDFYKQAVNKHSGELPKLEPMENEEYLESISFWKHKQTETDVRIVEIKNDSVHYEDLSIEKEFRLYKRKFLQFFNPII